MVLLNDGLPAGSGRKPASRNVPRAGRVIGAAAGNQQATTGARAKAHPVRLRGRHPGGRGKLAGPSRASDLPALARTRHRARRSPGGQSGGPVHHRIRAVRSASSPVRPEAGYPVATPSPGNRAHALAATATQVEPVDGPRVTRRRRVGRAMLDHPPLRSPPRHPVPQPGTRRAHPVPNGSRRRCARLRPGLACRPPVAIRGVSPASAGNGILAARDRQFHRVPSGRADDGPRAVVTGGLSLAWPTPRPEFAGDLRHPALTPMTFQDADKALLKHDEPVRPRWCCRAPAIVVPVVHHEGGLLEAGGDVAEHLADELAVEANARGVAVGGGAGNVPVALPGVIPAGPGRTRSWRTGGGGCHARPGRPRRCSPCRLARAQVSQLPGGGAWPTEPTRAVA